MISTRAAAVLIVASTLACSRGSSNLAGHWRGVRAEGVRGDAVDGANAYAAHMRVEVKGDSITLVTASGTRTDHYGVLEESAARTVITTDLDGAQAPQTFTFLDATTMKWTVSPGATVVFTRE